MRITRITTTIFPQSHQGQMIADEFEEKFKNQGCFGGRRETTQAIALVELCTISIEDEVEQ